MSIEIPVPDIGDFESVEIIEVLVKAGNNIKKILKRLLIISF